MRQTIAEYEHAGARVGIEVDTGGPVGGDHFVSVAKGNWRAAAKTDEYDPENWIVNRYFYFGEFNEQYARNFANKVATDGEYRQACVEGTADWKQIAEIYDEAARRIYNEFGDAGLLRYTAGDDDAERRYREATRVWERLCEEVFDEVKNRVRNGRSLDSLDEYIQARVDTASDEAIRLGGDQ